MRSPRSVLAFVAIATTAACSSKDPRLPQQTTPPTVPNSPPATAADATAASADAATPAPADAAPSPADTGTAVKTDAAGAQTEPPVDPIMLGDGIAEQKALLEGAKWEDAALLGTACDRALARAKAKRSRLHQTDVAPAEVLTVFDGMSLELDTIGGYVGLLFNVSPVKEVRDAAEKCRIELSKFSTDVSLDRAVFDQVAKVPTADLDAPTRYFVERSLRDFRLAGVDKVEATRQRISEINEELTKLSQDYQKNVNADTRAISVDPAALDGLPEDWTKAHAPGADGKVKVTTDYPDLFPFLTYANDAAARRALVNASAARGYPQNAEMVKKILTLRQELAKLVGYPNFAALDLADKMAGTPETVEKFLGEARAAGLPRMKSDLAELLARKQKLDKEATTVEVEDRFYYMQLVRKEKHGVDAKAVREYFAFDKVRDGIMALYGELFGIELRRRDDVKAWDPSVSAWEVARDGQVIGRFFLDMHPRADKYKHAAMFPIQTGLSGTDGQPSGPSVGTRLPWASLVCNFAAGSDLMEHKEVVTFFHEFGHLIHHLLAQNSKWLSTSGINVEWDFVEAPSQLLEEWAWDPKVLAKFAKNAAGKAIPAKMVEAMRKGEEFGKGVELGRQLFYAAYSFHLHQADPATLDLEAWTSDMYKEWSPYPRPSEDHLYTNFAHLIGYKSAYYTYQWSLAIAKDLFERFKEKGLLDPAVAADYRKLVLEPGGTDKADNLVKAFLGRDRNLDAYRAWITK